MRSRLFTSSILLSILLWFSGLVQANTVTLRPDGVGTYTQYDEQYPASGEHWDKVDEEISDEDSTYIRGDAIANDKDSYTLTDSGLPVGTIINWVRVYVRARKDIPPGVYLCTFIRTNGADYIGAENSLADTYADYSTLYATNPQTGINWTVAEIDALEAGALHPTTGGRTERVTQVWVVVDYTETPDHYVWSGGSNTYPYASWATAALNIQDAIDAASTGNTVWVRDGSYIGDVTINKNNLTLQSENGRDVTSITGQVKFDASTADLTGCTIDGFDVTDDNSDGIVYVYAVGSYQITNITIKNCKIHDNNAAGDNACGILLRGNVAPAISTNLIYSNAQSGIGCYYNGATYELLGTGTPIVIKGNTIGGSDQGNGEAGIYLWGSGTVIVDIGGAGTDKNFISYNVKSGIRLNTISDLTIDNNTINNNTLTGILLIDVGSGSGDVIVQNNDIYSNAKAGINIGGASYVTIGGDLISNKIYSNHAGVVFNMGEVQENPGNPSSQPVTIKGNDIYLNAKAGIAVIDYVDETTGTITINNNEIRQNTQAGIAIFNACDAVIYDNEIYTHTGAAGIFTGDWSVTYPPDGSGFDRTNGPATLTIKRNKVYGNRAGIRVDHASGTINNNLVYDHSMGGIRFSGDNYDTIEPTGWPSWGITQIINNTVADNGSGGKGGGIVYDDINTDGRSFFDPPVGSTQNPITIKNNIVANNERAGIKFCADNSGDNRSYNLFYNNYNCICDSDSCGGCSHIYCRSHHLGRCDPGPVNCCSESTWTNWATGEICGEDPLFDTDYTLLPGSPAIDAGDCGGPLCDMGAYGGNDPITW